ncbi:MAG: DUF1778 domain-containing protein [Acidobacteria bacterium]|nr:DUF1778 domain-containing protein [Acidobacteriota bacterium]
MATHPVTTRRTEKLDLRISRLSKTKLQTAASISHRSMSEFVVESALRRADEVLADRQTFALAPDRYKAFMNALDAPVRPLSRMKKLLREPGFFDLARKK